MIKSPVCIANGCPAPASCQGGGGWICAANRDAPADSWVAVTDWNVAHRWAYDAAARAEWLSSFEWQQEADKAIALCVRRGYPDWAPRVVRFEQSTLDRLTGSATMIVRDRDEREHGRLWANRLRREMLVECLRACGCLPKGRTEDNDEQPDCNITTKSAASLAKSVVTGLQADCAVYDIDGGAAGSKPILLSENDSGLQTDTDAGEDQ